MRAVVQRVLKAQVTVEGETVGRIGPGLLVLAAAGQDDHEADIIYLRDKILALRIFEDDSGRMNRCVREMGGSVLLVSQFTLYGDVRHGRRPSFTEAMEPAAAREFFGRFVASFNGCGVEAATGIFGAMMAVSLVNDGPVTILLDSKKVF